MEKVFRVKDARGSSKFVVDFSMESGCYYKHLDGKAPTLTNLLLALTHLVEENKVSTKEAYTHRDFTLQPNRESDIRYTPKLFDEWQGNFVQLPLTVDGDEVLDYEATIPADLVLKLVLGTTMLLGEKMVEPNRIRIFTKYGVAWNVFKRVAVV